MTGDKGPETAMLQIVRTVTVESLDRQRQGRRKHDEQRKSRSEESVRQ